MFLTIVTIYLDCKSGNFLDCTDCVAIAKGTCFSCLTSFSSALFPCCDAQSCCIKPSDIYELLEEKNTQEEKTEIKHNDEVELEVKNVAIYN